MPEELSIVIGADVSQAQAGLNSMTTSVGQLKDKLSELRAQLSTATNPVEIQRLNSAIVDTRNQIQSITAGSNAFATSTLGVSRATRTAHAELEGISQSIRGFADGSTRGVDALGNLVFTFERLQGQTGGVKSALSAIGETLLGPAGIVLAITTLLPLLANLAQEFIGDSEDAKKFKAQVDELKKSLDKLREPINITIATAIGSTGGEVNAVRTLIAEATRTEIQNGKETEASIERRRSALVKLNSSYSDLFNNIKFEKSLTESNSQAIIDAGNKEIDILKRKAEESSIDKTVTNAETVVRTTKQSIDNLKEDLNQRLKILGTTKEQIEQQIKLRDETEPVASPGGFLPVTTTIIGEKDLLDFENKLKTLSKGLGEAKIELAKHQIVQSDIISDQVTSGDFIEKAKKSIGDGLSELQKIHIKFARDAEKFFVVPFDLQITDLDTIKEQIKKAEDIISGIKEFKIPIKINLDPKITKQDIEILPVEIKDFDIKGKEKFDDRLQEGLSKGIFELKKVDVKAENILIDVPSAAQEKILDDFTKKFSGIISPKLAFDFTNAVIKGDSLKQKLLEFQAEVALATKEGKFSFEGTLDLALKFDQITASAKKVAEDIESTLTPAFQSLFDALVHGKDPVKAFFGAIVKGIEDVASKLIATEIQKQILALFIKSSDQSSGVSGAVGGIAGGVAIAAQQAAAATSLTGLTASAGTAALTLSTAFSGALTFATSQLIAMGFAAQANSSFSLLGLLGLGFAEGGEPPIGKASIVGEKGWELFVPKVPGTIISHDKSVSLLSNSVFSDSVKENNSVKEFLSAQLIKQQLERIESKLLNTVYKISEKSDLTSRNLIERFATHTEAINKFVQSSTTSNEAFKLVTNITNEKLTDSIKSFQYSTVEKIRESIFKLSEIKNPELIPASLRDVMRLFSSSHTETFNRTSTNGFYPQESNNSLIPFGFQEFHIKDTTEKLISSFKETLSNKFKTIIESSFSNNTLSSILQGHGSSRLQTVTEKSFDTNEILNRSFKSITDKFTDYKLINVSDKSHTESFYENQKYASLVKMVEGAQSKSYENIFKQLSSKDNNIKEVNTSFYNAFLSEITKEFIKQSLIESDSKTNSVEKFVTSIGSIKESFEKLIEKISNNPVQNFTSDKLTNKLVTNNIERISTERLQKEFHIPAFAGGGLVFGPTLGILGEGFGISRSNPEVIAPLNQLRNIVGGEFNFNHSFDGIFGISGADLLLTLSRASKTSQRVTGRNPFQ